MERRNCSKYLTNAHAIQGKGSKSHKGGIFRHKSNEGVPYLLLNGLQLLDLLLKLRLHDLHYIRALINMDNSCLVSKT